MVWTVARTSIGTASVKHEMRVALESEEDSLLHIEHVEIMCVWCFILYYLF